MKLTNLVLVAALGSSSAFSPPLSKLSTRSDIGFSRSTAVFATEVEPCEACETGVAQEEVLRLVDQPGSANILKGLVLADAEGQFVRLGGKMGDGKSIVIFLRHMG